MTLSDFTTATTILTMWNYMLLLVNRFVKYFTSNTTLLMMTLYNKNNSLIFHPSIVLHRLVNSLIFSDQMWKLHHQGTTFLYASLWFVFVVFIIIILLIFNGSSIHFFLLHTCAQSRLCSYLSWGKLQQWGGRGGGGGAQQSVWKLTRQQTNTFILF